MPWKQQVVEWEWHCLNPKAQEKGCWYEPDLQTSQMQLWAVAEVAVG